MFMTFHVFADGRTFTWVCGDRTSSGWATEEDAVEVAAQEAAEAGADHQVFFRRP